MSIRVGRRVGIVVLVAGLYLVFCIVGGVFVADGTLHPARRSLGEDEITRMKESARELAATLEDVSIRAADDVLLRGWIIRPDASSHDAVVLLHGLADNRVGMTGYAQLLIAHGYTVLLPDARSHGVSGGMLATYGLLERDDIRRWFQFLVIHEAPRCIFGFGESMGASQLLQSLSAEIRFCAVVAESPFASFREIAYDRLGQPFNLGPWIGRTLLRPLVEVAFIRAQLKYGLEMQRISPEDSVASSRVPVLLIHGQADNNIPVRHSRRIHARAPATRLWEVPGADHCGALSAAPREFEQRLLQWFSSHDTH